MQYSTNLNMNLPERADQYNLDHWNENTNILDTEIQNIKDLNDDTLKTSLLNFCYPVGSLYWSSKSTDPSTLFGGTWTPIKDCFVWAKGDNDTVNATGGAKTVTLTVDQIPSHNHSFTPSGTISVTTNPTFSGTAVDTDSKGSHSHTTNSQSATSTGNQTANPSFSGSASHSHKIAMLQTSSTWSTMVGYNDTNASGIVFAGNTNAPGWSGYASANKKFDPVIESSSVTISGTTTGNHTHSYSHTHGTDSQGSHKHSVTASGNISGGAYKFTGTGGTTGSKGGGQAHDNMPPYIVKYCWERTA